MEQLTALEEEAEVAANIAIGEQQFDRGEFVSLQAATALLETKWQQRSDHP
jgi:hypothetical protein